MTYSFQLYTLLVVDEYGNGIPVAFCFSNKSDTATYILFFKSAIDENIILGSTAGISSSTSLTDEINTKMEIIIGMNNRAGEMNLNLCQQIQIQ